MLYETHYYPQDQRGAFAVRGAKLAATTVPEPGTTSNLRATTRPKQHSHQVRQQPKGMPMPFDPEDLTKKLRAVLVQRQVEAEKRMEAKGARETNRAEAPELGIHGRSFTAAADDDQSYYIPRVAASQFERTATATKAAVASSKPIPRSGLVHKLSRRAMRFHLGDSSTATHVDPGAPPAEQTKGFRKAQEVRGKVLDRNQFQRDRILEEAAGADEERELRTKQRQKHSIERRLRGGSDVGRHSEDVNDGLRTSTSDVLRKGDLHDSGVIGHGHGHGHGYAASSDMPEHRVDWTQSDEVAPSAIKPKMKKMASSPLLLRRTGSVMALKGRLGSLSWPGRNETNKNIIISHVPEDGPGTNASDTSKSFKVGFFARFKVSH